MAADEEILRSRTDTAYFIILEEGPAVIVGRVDLVYFEEVEGFPLAVLEVRHHHMESDVRKLRPCQEAKELMAMNDSL